MIVMHDIRSKKEWSLSTFQIRIEDMDIVVMPGEYYNQNNVIFQTSEEKRFTIPGAGYYELWIYENGEMKLEKDTPSDAPYIDMLLWVEVPEGAKSLADAEINFKRFLEVE